jgi:hypothetical protein
MTPGKTKLNFPLSQYSVPVRYAHLHGAPGEGERNNNNDNNKHPSQSTKSISGLDPLK